MFCPGKHLFAALELLGSILVLPLAINSKQTFAGASPSSSLALAELSFSECLQLERSPSDAAGGGNGRTAKVLSVREGMPAYLHCPRNVAKGANLKGAWTRMRDAALLAVGTDTFTQDLRFQISKPRDEQSDWVLILRRTSLEDQGCYLCEVNTEPVSTLVPIYLKVNPHRKSLEQKHREGPLSVNSDADQSNLRGTRLQARLEGSTLVLNCTVEKGHHEAGFWPTIVWAKDERPLDLRNEKKFSTDFRLSDARDALVFILRVRHLSPVADSGVYSCQGDGLTRAAEIVSLPSVAAAAANAAGAQCAGNLMIWMALITSICALPSIVFPSIFPFSLVERQ